MAATPIGKACGNNAILASGSGTVINISNSNVVIGHFDTSAGIYTNDFLDAVHSHMKMVARCDVSPSLDESEGQGIPIALPRMTSLNQSEQRHQSIPNFVNNPEDSGSVGLPSTGNVIDLSRFHEPCDGNDTKHTMIVGELGSGKTVTAKAYTTAVSEGEFDQMEDISLVHYAEASSMQFDSPSSAFDLIFVQQIQSLVDNEDLREAGEKWIRENSNKVLLVINGLDEFSEPFLNRFSTPTVRHNTKARPTTIVANILSQNIWPGIRVLTTSRWTTYLSLPNQLRPDRLVCMEEFRAADVEKMMENLLVDDQLALARIKMKQHKPLRSLCSRPLGLKYTTELFRDRNSPLHSTLSGILSFVFVQISESQHIRGGDNLDNVMKLAYDSLKKSKLKFSQRYLRRLGCELSKAWLSPVNPVLALTADKTKWSFLSLVIQEILATLHLFQLPLEEAHHFVLERMHNFEVMRLLFYGIAFNPEITDVMKGFIDDDDDDGVMSLEECQNMLKYHMKDLIPNGMLSGIKNVVLLNECGHEFLLSCKKIIKEIIIGDIIITTDELQALENLVRNCSPSLTLKLEKTKLDINGIEIVARICEMANSSRIYRVHVTVADDQLADNQRLALTKLYPHVVDCVMIECRSLRDASITYLESYLRLPGSELVITSDSTFSGVILSNQELMNQRNQEEKKRKASGQNRASGNDETQCIDDKKCVDEDSTEACKADTADLCKICLRNLPDSSSGSSDRTDGDDRVGGELTKSYHSFNNLEDEDVVCIKNAIFHNDTGHFISRLWTNDETWEKVENKFLSKGYKSVEVEPTVLFGNLSEALKIKLFEHKSQEYFKIDEKRAKSVKIKDVVKTGYISEYFVMAPAPEELVSKEEQIGKFVTLDYSIQVNGNAVKVILIRLRCRKEQDLDEETKELLESDNKMERHVNFVYNPNYSRIGQKYLEKGAKFEEKNTSCPAEFHMKS